MKANYSNLSLIAENLGHLYEDGINISEGILLLNELPLKKQYKNSIKTIYDEILKGSSLSKAFKKNSDIYPGFFIGILSVGENSGQLGKALRCISEFYLKLDRISKEIMSAMIYPGFLLVSLIALGIFLSFIVIPNLYETYKTMNTEIPKIAEILFSIKSYLVEEPLISSLFIVCWIPIPPIIIWVLANNDKGKNRLIKKLKIVRELQEFILILILSVLLNSGVSLPLGFQYCIESGDIRFLKDEFERVNKDIIEGKELSSSLENTEFISKYTLSIIKLGENSGSLSERVSKLEKRLERVINGRVSKLLSLIQPTIVVSMAVGILLFIFIFVLPIFEMMYSKGV